MNTLVHDNENSSGGKYVVKFASIPYTMQGGNFIDGWNISYVERVLKAY